MIRLPACILVGCVVRAELIPIEIGSVSSHRPLPEARPEARLPPADVEPAAPEIRKLAKETPSSANDADSPLRDVRLTGVVIGPDLRMAIFAVTGTNSRVLSEGETLNGWRLESISPKVVMLTIARSSFGSPTTNSAAASKCLRLCSISRTMRSPFRMAAHCALGSISFWFRPRGACGGRS